MQILLILYLKHVIKYYGIIWGVTSSIIDVLVMQSRKTRVLYCRIKFYEGFRLFICWLMMKLAIGSNKELRYMHMHITRVGFEKFKLPRMAYIISC